MKKNIIRDKKCRKLEHRFYLKRFFLKYLLYKKYIFLYPKLYESIQKKLEKIPKNSSKTRLLNLCFLTGRSNAVFRKFKLSRINIRELGSNGQLPGLKKSSW